MEKLAFSLVRAARKLKPYLQAHVINVLIDQPLKKAMNKLEAAGWLIQWAVELSEFDVWYRPREVIKTQVLSEFIVEFTPANNQQNKDRGAKQWVIHMDGSSAQHVGGIGIVLQLPEEDHLEYAVRLQFNTTNNEAKYEALLQGLELAKSLGADLVLIQGDSQLVIGQVNGKCEAKEERM